MLGLSSGASASTIYIADGLNLNSYTTSGGLLNTFTGATGDVNVRGMIFSSGGVLYVASHQNNAIYSYTPSGASFTKGTVASNVSNPVALALNGYNDLFTSTNSGSGSTIEEITTGGTVLATTFTAPVANPVTSVDALYVDGNGNLYEADDSGYINEFLYNNGAYSSSITLAPDISQNGAYANFYGMTMDNSGDIFVSFRTENQKGGGVEEITPGSSTASVYYSLSAASAPFFLPNDLAYDSVTGNLYLSYVTTTAGSVGGADVFLANGSGSLGLTGTPAVFASNLNLPYGIASLYGTPEPGTMTMLLGGLIALSLSQVRRLRKQ
jgi:hypothetical protein